jgi:hypothetical protein
MKFVTRGKQHTRGDRDCIACVQPVEGEHWPKRHAERGVTCGSLVHCELVPAGFQQTPDIKYYCENCLFISWTS